MKNTKLFINLWYLSIGCISAGLLTFVIGMYAKNLYCWGICGLFFIAFTVLFTVSNKKLKLEQGYTVVQAMIFYKECRKAGIKKNYRAEIAVKAAGNFDFAKNLSESQVKELFNIGEQYVREYRRKK